MTPQRSATQQLAETLLGCDLAEWLHSTRYPAPGATRSYEWTAQELAAATDGRIRVSGETLRKWDIRFKRENGAS